MKKTAALLLTVLLMLAALAGCGAGKADETPDHPANDPAAQEGTSQPTETDPTGQASPDGSVIFEKDGVKVTTAGLDLDPTNADPQPVIWLDIENTGSQDVYLGVANGSVNGFMSTVVLAEFSEEDGVYNGASYDFGCTVPAGGSVRRALTYYQQNIAGVKDDTLGVLEFSFTTSPDEFTWRDYVSDPVTIATGETVGDVDIRTLGDVVLDNDKLTLVIGAQDYDSWFGPEISVYAENKTDGFLGIAADTAEADGTFCDYIYYGTAIAPGKKDGGRMSFDGEMRELKGIEKLTVNFKLCEAAAVDDLDSMSAADLGPVSVQYPPQVWGEYENGGLSFTVRPRINDLLTVKTPEDGFLFDVYETASLEAGNYDGAGWLLAIGKVSTEELHGMLCGDMSGENVFARDEDGNYYIAYTPTDVRYERATAEEMQRDLPQWTMLCEWVEDALEGFTEENGLESASFGNTSVDICLARAAYRDGGDATLSTTEYGPVSLEGVDGASYAEFVMQFGFDETEDAVPDGEYVVLSFPEEDIRLDFFFAPGSYVRMVSGGTETLYQSFGYDDNISIAEAMQGWYYAAAEHVGVKPVDESLARYCGEWHETIAGRGMISVGECMAPGKVKIEAWWPESAAVMDTWEIVATLRDGRLVYENGVRESTEYDADGNGQTLDWSDEESGYFYLGDAGELIWHDDSAEGGEDSVFIK